MLLSLTLLSAQSSCPRDTAELLRAIYAKTNGPSWKRGQDWATAEDACRADGVFCDAENRVLALDLSDFGLEGPLPAEIGCFSGLKSLYLNGNKLGSFPAEICEYSASLQFFQASSAEMSGNLPECVCDIFPLQYLYVDNNELTGEIPACVQQMPNLREFVATCNSLQGPMFSTRAAVSPALANWFVSCNDLECSDAMSGVNAVCESANCDFCGLVCPATLEVPVCGRYFFVPRDVEESGAESE